MKRGYKITSRIGKRPIPLPAEVTVRFDGSALTIEGPEGLERHDPSRSGFRAVVEGGVIRLEPIAPRASNNRMIGLERAIIQNLVTGVRRPFERSLELRGTGFRAEVKDKTIELRLGFSHPLALDLPEGVAVVVEKQTIIHLRGRRKDQVGQLAATLRSLRPPDPYKGKGVRYLGEVVSLKPGKAAKTVAVT